MQKLTCYRDKIVLVEEGKILKKIILEEELLKGKIDEEINNKNSSYLTIRDVFQHAVEGIVPYKFFDKNQKVYINGECVSIHDQEIFKKWKKYITSKEEVQKHLIYTRLTPQAKKTKKIEGLLAKSNKHFCTDKQYRYWYW